MEIKRMSLASTYNPSESPARWVEDVRGPIEKFRAANAEDQETLDALDRLERGESKSELVGFDRLEVSQ